MPERDNAPERDDGPDQDDGPDEVPVEDIAQLAGLRDPADQSAVFPADEIDRLGEITETAVSEGGLEARAPGDDQPDDPDEANLELLLDDELRDGETDDPGEATEEGLTWVPPVDPPVFVRENGEVDVAAGFGSTADDDPFDEHHHRSLELAGDERTERVREALLAHAQTVGVADRLQVETEGSVVIVRGTVDDLVDEDAVLAVISEVDGVADIVSRIEVLAIDGVDRR